MTEQECAVRLFLKFGDTEFKYADLDNYIAFGGYENPSRPTLSELINHDWVVNSGVYDKPFRVNTDKIKEVLDD